MMGAVQAGNLSPVADDYAPPSVVAAQREPRSGSGHLVASWSEIAAGVAKNIGALHRNTDRYHASSDQLASLIKLQVEVNRYQLGVEVVSKVSECAAASLRKLQQQQ